MFYHSKKKCSVISALVEGNSIRSTERMFGIHRDTIMRLMVRVGNKCETLLDRKMRNLQCKKIQVDEIWQFVGKKKKNLLDTDNPKEVGDFWTFVSIDADSKLIPNHLVGKRDLYHATAFLKDLSDRLSNRIQLSSDALPAYAEAAEQAFAFDVDYGQIIKVYESDTEGTTKRYSPPQVVRTTTKRIVGQPDIAHVSTSFVERQNLTMRMSIRRMTRLTNAFSKKLDNFKAAVALHFAHYNFCRIHKTIRTTPAMEAGIERSLWSIQDLLIECGESSN